MTAPAKAATISPESKAELPRSGQQSAGATVSPVVMAGPIDRLQGGAGNRAISALLVGHPPRGIGGMPLPPVLRAAMETGFAEDFAAVRLHVDGDADRSAAALRAKAYTSGENIVFADRHYAPDSFEGRRLLAHELAHVVQQRRGGAAPQLRRDSPAEQAAEAAARLVARGASGVAVAGASGIGVARDGAEDDEIERALSTWTHLDQQTEEEARRKPGSSPKRDAGSETTTPTTDPPPKPDKIDPALRDKSRALRDQRRRALKRRDRAVRRGQDPNQFDARPRPSEVAPYQDAVRGATNQGDARHAAQRHADLVRHQPAMSHQDMYNKVLAMRGFEAGPAVWERERLQREYDGLKKQLASNPDAAQIDALHEQNTKLKREIAKLDREAKKQGKLGTEDQQRRDQLKETLDHNTATIEASPVTALRKRSAVLHDKLAISGLRDPDAPKGATGAAAASKGAPAGRGENTYAIVQVVGPDGKIIAWGAGKNTDKGHAEENALVQIRQQVKGLPKGLPPGSRVEVVGDQVVCSEICKPALTKFAVEHGVESVDGYTFHAVKPAGGGAPQVRPSLSAKTTAKEATTAEAGDWALERKHEPIYTRTGGPQGGVPPTPAEKHRHARKRAKPRAPAAGGGAKGPPARSVTGPGKPRSAAKAPAPRPRKPVATGRAPAGKGDTATTPARRRAAPTASNAAPRQRPKRQKVAAPAWPTLQNAGAVRKPAAPAAQRAATVRSKSGGTTPPAKRVAAPAKPPPAPPAQQQRPTPTGPGRRRAAPAIAGGNAPLPSPAAKARAGRRVAPAVSPARPPGKAIPAKRAAPAPRRPARPAPPTRSVEGEPSRTVTHGGGVFVAPGTAGGSAQFGAETKHDLGKGVTLGPSVGFDGSVSVNVTEIPDTNPQRYHVSLHIDLRAALGLSAGREGETLGGGASVSASGALSGSFGHDLSAEQAQKYRAAAESGSGGGYGELEIVRLISAHKLDAARAYLDQAKAATGSAEAARQLHKGDVIDVSAEGSVGGDLHGSIGQAGVALGIFRSGRVERRVEERDGKILVTMTIAGETGTTLGATASEGIGKFGYAHTSAESRLRSVTFSLDPDDANFAASYKSIASATSIEDLDRLRGARPDLAGATTKGTGTSHSDTVTAGLGGAGVQFIQGGSYDEEETRDASGVSHRYTGSSSGGLKVTAGDDTLASTTTTDTFTADVGPDNRATGQTGSQRSETDFGRSIDQLRKSFAKNPRTTTAGILTGKTKLLQERVDQTGTALTDDSFSRLAALAENPVEWEHAWVAGHGDLIEWRKARHKILAAHGDRNAIARAVAQFEGGGDLGSSTVEKALGGVGIAFEFPDEIADQKAVYDSLVVGDPIGHARELAQRGQQEAALTELNTASDKLGKLVAAAQAHSGAFESTAKLAEMLNRVADRRSQLRAEIAQLNRAAQPQPPAPKPEIGPPTAQQAAEDDAERSKKLSELILRQTDLINACILNRTNEIRDFTYVRNEMDSFHLDHLSASVDLQQRLSRVRDSYAAWDETIKKLKEVYQELGQDPGPADALGPDRKQWSAVNDQWQHW